MSSVSSEETDTELNPDEALRVARRRIQALEDEIASHPILMLRHWCHRYGLVALAILGCSLFYVALYAVLPAVTIAAFGNGFDCTANGTLVRTPWAEAGLLVNPILHLTLSPIYSGVLVTTAIWVAAVLRGRNSDTRI